MSQENLILNHLQQGKTITPLESLQLYGCFRLGARIMELKQQGHNIVNEWETNGKKRYAKYKLIPKGDLYDNQSI